MWPLNILQAAHKSWRRKRGAAAEKTFRKLLSDRLESTVSEEEPAAPLIRCTIFMGWFTVEPFWLKLEARRHRNKTSSSSASNQPNLFWFLYILYYYFFFLFKPLQCFHHHDQHSIRASDRQEVFSPITQEVHWASEVNWWAAAAPDDAWWWWWLVFGTRCPESAVGVNCRGVVFLTESLLSSSRLATLRQTEK